MAKAKPIETLPVEPLLVSASNAAAMVGVSRSLFYQMLNSGRLPVRGIRFGRKRLYRVQELKNWVDAGCPPRSHWEVKQ